MTVISERGLCAVCYVARDMEKICEESVGLSLDDRYNRLLVGKMITFIMRKYGYTVREDKPRVRVRKKLATERFKTGPVFIKDDRIETKYRLK